ncbi:MAG TPA: 2-succinyl-5-enolpyruvyl-6-hydroxy-3-cyclohexene-1-carboxylic-acid synthase [Prochlorococcus sp.]
MSIARNNLLVCLRLLDAFQAMGLRHLVLCPGSRSGPLAVAAGGMARANRLRLSTAIDERSAAFLALGLSSATGCATAVVTTSGTAVANLLPAAVEADRSSQPLLLLTADRPDRLKDCGANQTVNQEAFLAPVCRWVGHGPREGLHLFSTEALESFVEQAWLQAHHPAGPVHLNLPLEEPLHASEEEQGVIWKGWAPRSPNSSVIKPIAMQMVGEVADGPLDQALAELDPLRPGVVVAGPWRGLAHDLFAFQQSLREWQALSGWPVFADPLSGVPADQPGLILAWELMLAADVGLDKQLQVLRLGPIPASRSLEAWLISQGEGQLLITEGESRCLDPLGLSIQRSNGLANWWQRHRHAWICADSHSQQEAQSLLKGWQAIDCRAQDWLDQQLPLQGAVTEPALARWLSRLLPAELPIMLAASSPVRDWLSYADVAPFSRRCFSFRGASGIDGTLSMAMGLAMALGPTVLVSGDLALLHDSNGWLLAHPQRPPLVVVLIDNGGGGIFQQLPLKTAPSEAFEQLFAMPQVVDPLALAAAHGIPHRQLACLEDLPEALDWSFAQAGPVLLRVCTHRGEDSSMRQQLREDLAKHLQVISHNGCIDL